MGKPEIPARRPPQPGQLHEFGASRTLLEHAAVSELALAQHGPRLLSLHTGRSSLAFGETLIDGIEWSRKLSAAVHRDRAMLRGTRSSTPRTPCCLPPGGLADYSRPPWLSRRQGPPAGAVAAVTRRRPSKNNRPCGNRARKAALLKLRTLSFRQQVTVPEISM